MKKVLVPEKLTLPSLFSPPLLIAFFVFILIGISTGISGVLLPSLSAYYHVNNSVLGLLFLVPSIGYFLSALTAGMLIERLGMRGFLLVGAGIFVLGAFAFGLKPPFALVLMTRFALGLGVGMMETGLNIFISNEPRSASRLNYLHAFYGVGALLGPVLASTILVLRWDWNIVYLLLGGLSVPMLLGFWFAFTRPIPTSDPVTQEVQREKSVGLGATLKLGIVWLATLFLLFYVGVEVSLGNWSYTYLLAERHQNALVGGWIVSGYWFGLTMGRFVLQGATARLGISDTQLVYGCIAGVIIGIALIWFVPLGAVAALGFWLIGFSLGPIYPLTIALMPKLVPTRIAASAIGFVIGVSIIGLALFPWVAGILAQQVGIWSLLPYSIALAIVMFGLWRSLWREGK